jgi:hypothetical protein
VESAKSTSSAKGLIKKWGLVGIGVCLTIASAIVSNYFIAKNNDLVTEWEREVQNVTQQMEAIWENTRSLERRKDTAILMLVENAQHPESKAFVKDTMSLFGQGVGNDSEQATYRIIQERFNDYKGDVLDRIDDRYLIKQDLLEQIQDINNDNDVLMNIALCFQILGLIFVLSRGAD